MRHNWGGEFDVSGAIEKVEEGGSGTSVRRVLFILTFVKRGDFYVSLNTLEMGTIDGHNIYTSTVFHFDNESNDSENGRSKLQEQKRRGRVNLRVFHRRRCEVAKKLSTYLIAFCADDSSTVSG